MAWDLPSVTASRAATPRVLGAVRAAVARGGELGTVLLLAHVLADAVLRFVFNRPLTGTIEYVSFWWMVAIVFLGLSIAERDDEHIDAPIVFDRLPAPLQREFAVFGRLLFLAVLAALGWWGWQEAVQQQSFGARGGAAGVSTWPGRYLLPVGAAACALEVVARILATLRTPAGDDSGIEAGEWIP